MSFKKEQPSIPPAVILDSDNGVDFTFKGMGLNSNHQLERQHAKMLEILERLASYPVASTYPDGPCIEREDMMEIKSAIADAKPRHDNA